MSTSQKEKNEELVKVKFWRSHIDQWTKSGLSQAEYCRKSEIHRGKFIYWKRKLKKQNLPVEFVQVPIPTSVKSVGLKLNVGREVQIEIPDGFNNETLERVLLTLKAAS